MSILSFKDWSSSNSSVPYSDRLSRYEDYLQDNLVDQITNSDEGNLSSIRGRYKQFLTRLTVIYQDDPEVLELSNVNLDNDQELISAIPIFSRKIRDIALFFKNKRVELSNKKIEYSTKGSELGMENEVRRLLLNTYTTRSDGYIDPTISNRDVAEELPDRNILDDRLEVDVIELYNTSKS